MVVLPLESFEASTLDALLADIVTRDGTDYGDVELSQDEKIAQLLHTLQRKKAFIGFDSISESCMIISAEEANEVGLLHYAE